MIVAVWIIVGAIVGAIVGRRINRNPASVVAAPAVCAVIGAGIAALIVGLT